MHATVNGARLYYERDGAGNPPLLFVHGYTCAHGDWVRQVEAFKPRHTVVTCDLRGHGASPGEPSSCDIETYGADIAGLLPVLGLEGAVLVGHSMGCRVVLQAYRAARERIAGLVLVDGSFLGAAGESAEKAARDAVADKGFAGFVRPLFADMFLAPSKDAERIIERAMRTPETIGASLFPKMVAWDAKHMLAALTGVKAPLLVIQCTYLNSEHKRVPLKPGQSTPCLDLVRQRAPRAQIRIITGSGHFPMLDNPAAVNSAIAAFVEGVMIDG